MEATELLEQLAQWGIAAPTKDHEPVFTVEESQRLRGGSEEGHTKNLYLRDKKKNNYLVTVDENAQIDLKLLSEKLGSSRLSFGSSDRLHEFLGVVPGSVSPLALINDPDAKVSFWLQRKLAEGDLIRCHPLDNSKTTTLATSDLAQFVKLSGHELNVLDM